MTEAIIPILLAAGFVALLLYTVWLQRKGVKMQRTAVEMQRRAVEESLRFQQRSVQLEEEILAELKKLNEEK